MLTAFDAITGKAIKKEARRAFRVDSVSEQLKVDLVIDEKSLMSLISPTIGVEEAVNHTSVTGSNTSIKTLAPVQGKGDKGDRQGGKDDGKSSGKKGKDGKVKGKNGKGMSTTCRFFLTESGCSQGGECEYYHSFLKPEEQRRYASGSNQRRMNDCVAPKKEPSDPTKGDDGKNGKPTSKGNDGKGVTKGMPQVKPTTAEQGEETTGESPSSGKGPEPEKDVSEKLQDIMVKGLNIKQKENTSATDDLDQLVSALSKKMQVDIKTIRILKHSSLKKKWLVR